MSGRVVAATLRSDGHDVVALSEEQALAGLSDAEVLELAVRERRILVTHNVKDFVPLLRTLTEGGGSHSGCILVQGLRHAEFGRVIRGLRQSFTSRPEAETWENLAIVLSPATAD